MSYDRDLLFSTFRSANVERCALWHPIESWDLDDWYAATLGELGELSNVVKKLNRVRDNMVGNKEVPEELAAKVKQEVADVVIYLDLLAARQKITWTEAFGEWGGARHNDMPHGFYDVRANEYAFSLETPRHEVEDWTPSRFMVEAGKAIGRVGRALDYRAQGPLAFSMVELIVILERFAYVQGIDMAEAIVETFNNVSIRNGFDVRL